MAEGKITLTTYLDRKELAQGGAKMALDYLAGEKVDVKDYSQYDNGTKIVGTFSCGAQLIDKDNYQILVDNGTYDEEEIKPDPHRLLPGTDCYPRTNTDPGSNFRS